eukprot:4557396-Pyramimonas_sp.AAC.1
MGLVISEAKTGFLVNSEDLGDALDGCCAHGPLARWTGARCLGGDATDGRWRRVGEQDARLGRAAA